LVIFVKIRHDEEMYCYRFVFYGIAILLFSAITAAETGSWNGGGSDAMGLSVSLL